MELFRAHDDALVDAVRVHPVPVSPKTSWIFVEVTLRDGTCGFGEATAFGEEEGVVAEAAAYASQLASKNLRAIGEALSAVMQVQMSSARRAFANGLEQALHDALARKAGVALSLFLGGNYRETVPCYANINRGIADRSPGGFAAQASGIIEKFGYRAIKIAPFDGLRWTQGTIGDRRKLFTDGLERIAAVRSAIGPDVDLLVDCHARFDMAMAISLMREISGFGIYWVEEPIDMVAAPVADRIALRSAAHAAGTMIGGGETIRSLGEAQQLLAAGGHDVILPDLRFTGLRTGMAILELALAFGVHASLHNPAGPVLDAVSRHVAAALPAFLILERQVGESPFYDAIRNGPALIADGGVTVEKRPGIGFVPDPKVLAEAVRSPVGKSSTFSNVPGAGPDA